MSEEKWDVKCTTCEWKGTIDEADYDEEYDCSVCPVCGDHELELRDDE